MSTVRQRVVEAAARSVTAAGMAATTVDAIAREAGVARGTVYRHFKGGRREILDELVRHEVEVFFHDLYLSVDGFDNLREVAQHGLAFARNSLATHSILQRFLSEDPRVLEPALGDSVDAMRDAIAGVLRPFVSPDEDREENVDFLVRMGLSYMSTAGRWDMSSPADLARLVDDELISGLVNRDCKYDAIAARRLRRVSDESMWTRGVNATLEEIAAGRFAEFTFGDIVTRVGTSRATLYRAFPGGRPALLAALTERESARLFSAVADAISSASDIHEGLLSGLTTLWAGVATHLGILGLQKSAPEVIFKALNFDGATRTYALASSFAQPLLGRWTGPDTSAQLAEWMCRLVVAYSGAPCDYLDVTDAASVANFYSRHVANGVDRILATVPAKC
ncbi:MAG: TetR family transcriptional regulator [Actinomycetota bacterium]